MENEPGKNEAPNRVDLHDALEQYPNSFLLNQIEKLSNSAFAALFHAHNMDDFTFIDFAIYEEDGRDTSLISEIIEKLELANDDKERKMLVEAIAAGLKN